MASKTSELKHTLPIFHIIVVSVREGFHSTCRTFQRMTLLCFAIGTAEKNACTSLGVYIQYDNNYYCTLIFILWDTLPHSVSEGFHTTCSQFYSLNFKRTTLLCFAKATTEDNTSLGVYTCDNCTLIFLSCRLGVPLLRGVEGIRCVFCVVHLLFVFSRAFL